MVQSEGLPCMACKQSLFCVMLLEDSVFARQYVKMCTNKGFSMDNMPAYDPLFGLHRFSCPITACHAC